jgi:mono/diheme cytochrome c family protein
MSGSMPLSPSRWAVAIWLGGSVALYAFITPQPAAQLPPPANRRVDFAKEIKPIFESSCIECHGRGKDEGGFKIDSRETLLKGGDSGPAILVGKSADSLLIELVQSVDPDSRMPKKGSHLTPQQIGLLRAWIDQGAAWTAGVSFGRLEPNNLKPRRPPIPSGPKDANSVDLFLQPYFAAHHIKPAPLVNDRAFARRVYLDVIGLLPSPEELNAFAADKRGNKRERLVKTLLADNRNYALHWMTFWNDALRNDYRGTGYIDGGRKQITSWLYAALATNMPYDRFVARLIDPTPDSEGFSKGIVWRGVVNASQTPQMQAAQNISQVFMGVNLKCASCHNSFINDLTLADAYGLAGIYSDGALEMVHCDKPTGKRAALKFLYPELGAIDPKAGKAARLKRLAEVITAPTDGRLTRTIVNRYWQKLMGRGLVEPVDDMEKAAWHADLLDWAASDLVDRHYDLKHLIEVILTSRAYQMPAVSFDEKNSQDYVFTGPLVRRMSAEQFRDALGELTGVWYDRPAVQLDFTLGHSTTPLKAKNHGKVRAVLANADVLQVAMGRPNREQTVTTRNSVATTLEALELTNGRELAEIVRRGAQNALAEHAASTEELTARLYARALGRKPTAEESELAKSVVGQPAQPDGVEDLLWALAMLPEFQLIY